MAQGVRGALFRKHTISGAGHKKNVRCPNCGSIHRTRLLHLFFEHRTRVFQDSVRLLHVSPHRHLAHFLKDRDTIDYVSGALFPERLPNLPAVRVDVTDIGFDDKEFDVVICNHVLEHVRDDETAMRELYRVLKPGGFAIMQVPLALDLNRTLEDPAVVEAQDRKVQYGQKDHLRLYGLDYFSKLGDAGFRVERDNPFANEWVPGIETYRLDRNEDVFVGFRD